MGVNADNQACSTEIADYLSNHENERKDDDNTFFVHDCSACIYGIDNFSGTELAVA